MYPKCHNSYYTYIHRHIYPHTYIEIHGNIVYENQGCYIIILKK